jgi:hypothetical protein
MPTTRWEYCILTRLSTELDTKWHVNRVFLHHATELPTEMTEPEYAKYNDQFEKLHASKVYPVLPAVLNLLGADGWELIDDMNTGLPGGEGLVFKRPLASRATRASARRPGGRASSRRR